MKRSHSLKLESVIKDVIENWPIPSEDRRNRVAEYMAKNAPTKYDFGGIRIPVVRQSFKSLRHQNFPFAEQIQTFTDLWMSSNLFEGALLSLYWLESLDLQILIKEHKSILKWSARIDNWAHSDGYSGILAKIYEARPDLLDPYFESWRSHKNPWLRRLSIVGLLYYSRMRTKVPTYKKLISSVEPLVLDHDYYVQKGVGWTIREIYNLYPEKTFPFMVKNSKNFHPAAWYAVTEKLSPAEKKKIKSVRFSK